MNSEKGVLLTALFLGACSSGGQFCEVKNGFVHYSNGSGSLSFSAYDLPVRDPRILNDLPVPNQAISLWEKNGFKAKLLYSRVVLTPTPEGLKVEDTDGNFFILVADKKCADILAAKVKQRRIATFRE